MAGSERTWDNYEGFWPYLKSVFRYITLPSGTAPDGLFDHIGAGMFNAIQRKKEVFTTLFQNPAELTKGNLAFLAVIFLGGVLGIRKLQKMYRIGG